MPGQKIGDLNGWWALLLKLHMVAVPPIVGAIVALMVWIVSQQFADIAFRNSGERFSRSDAYVMEANIREREQLSKQAILAKIELVETRLNDVEKNLARVLVILEREDRRP